jgi:hypothetical protein
MKCSYHITNCEFCNKTIRLDSPPSDDRYEDGEIFITHGTVLLSKSIVEKNHKHGISDSHAEYIAGYYCNYKCLVGQIKKILHIKR